MENTTKEMDAIKEYQHEIAQGRDHIDLENNEPYLNSKSIMDFLRDADKGDAVAQSVLVEMHSQGIFPDNDTASESIAKIYLASLASLKNATAENFYNMLDAGVFENGEEALKWFFKDINHNNVNNVDAQYYFSMRFMESDIGDDKEAIKWILSEAERGNAKAQYSLGELFMHGARNAPVDFAIERVGWGKAAEWFLKAAEQGDSEAQYRLGGFYQIGYLDKDPGKEEKWFKKAAEQGHVEAQYKLGRFYAMSGDKKAVYWTTKASEQGHVEAQSDLDDLHYWAELEKEDKFNLASIEAQATDEINSKSNPPKPKVNNNKQDTASM